MLHQCRSTFPSVQIPRIDNDMVRRLDQPPIGDDLTEKEDHHMQITSIGIDLGKTTFHLVGLDKRGKVVLKKKFSRKQLLAYTANLPKSLNRCRGDRRSRGATEHALCADQDR
jgi:hypothetical protein